MLAQSKLNYLKFSLNIDLLKFTLSEEKFQKGICLEMLCVLSIWKNMIAEGKFISRVIDMFQT